MKNRVIGFVTGVKSKHDVATQKTKLKITIQVEDFPVVVGEYLALVRTEKKE